MELAGDALGAGEEVREDGVIFGGDGHMAGVMLFGDEENVDGGLGGKIAKGEDVVVFIKNVSGHLAIDDALEDSFGHGPLPDGEFELRRAESGGASADKVNDIVVEALARGTPGGGAGEGENTGAKALEAKDG